MTGLFLAVSRILPNLFHWRVSSGTTSPASAPFGRLFDLGVIAPRLTALLRLVGRRTADP
jgi:hypothetical protein